MMTNDQLYALCDQLCYRVRPAPLQSAPAASLPGGCIVLNPEQIPDAASEKTILAHELGHLQTGSFPSASPADLDGRHEERANRWAIRTLLPADELCAALEGGMVELYQLAEHFGVTEELVLKAVEYYQGSAGLSLTAREQQATVALKSYRPVTALFRNGGEAVRLLLPAKLLDSFQPPIESNQVKESSPRWGFVRDGYRVFFDETEQIDF